MRSGELCTRLVMTEQLQRPTPELTHALGELISRLVLELLRHPIPELSYTLKDAIAMFIWNHLEIPELLWHPHTGAVTHAL